MAKIMSIYVKSNLQKDLFKQTNTGVKLNLVKKIISPPPAKIILDVRGTPFIFRLKNKQNKEKKTTSFFLDNKTDLFFISDIFPIKIV